MGGILLDIVLTIFGVFEFGDEGVGYTVLYVIIYSFSRRC